MTNIINRILERIEDLTSLRNMERMEKHVGKKQTCGFGLGVRAVSRIIQEEIETHNLDWIPCNSGQLPTYTNEVWVTVRWENGEVYTAKGVYSPAEKRWLGCNAATVIAWKPLDLPMPYKED